MKTLYRKPEKPYNPFNLSDWCNYEAEQGILNNDESLYNPKALRRLKLFDMDKFLKSMEYREAVVQASRMLPSRRFSMIEKAFIEETNEHIQSLGLTAKTLPKNKSFILHEGLIIPKTKAVVPKQVKSFDFVIGGMKEPIYGFHKCIHIEEDDYVSEGGGHQQNVKQEILRTADCMVDYLKRHRNQYFVMAIQTADDNMIPKVSHKNLFVVRTPEDLGECIKRIV